MKIAYLINDIFFYIIVVLGGIAFIVFILAFKKMGKEATEEYKEFADQLGLEYSPYKWSLLKSKYNILHGKYRGHDLEIYIASPIYAPIDDVDWQKFHFKFDGKVLYKEQLNRGPSSASQVDRIRGILKDLENKGLIK